MNITEIIEQTRQRYVREGLALGFRQINHGLCEDFAMDVIQTMGGYSEALFEMEGANLMADGDVWDWDLLEGFWGIGRPANFTQDEFDALPFGNHIFIVYNKRFYDSECPDGVIDIFELPYFRRTIDREIENRKSVHIHNIVG